MLSVVALAVAFDPSSPEAAENDNLSKIPRIATTAALAVDAYEW